ncbi:MAG: deaminase, partial [Bacillota bacterium]
MRRPYTVVLVEASVDGRISLGPNRTMFDDLADPRMTGRDIWRDTEERIYALHNPGADVLGSNSLVREGDELRQLPSFDGTPEPLYYDYLPEEVIGRDDHRGW